MVFTTQKKKLLVAGLVVTGVLLIAIGVTRHSNPHRMIPSVLGGAFIAIGLYVATIEPGEYWRRKRKWW